MSRKAYVCLVAWLLASPSRAEATAFNFDFTFNGVFITVDPSSDPVAGTSLVPGDTFTIDVRAESNDYWQVGATFVDQFFATFFVLSGGTRTGDATTSLWLDGGLVAQATQLNLAQAAVHMGAQSFPFVAGTQFDRLLVTYQFSSSTAASTTIQGSSPGFSPFYLDPNIVYVQAPDPVPEPATLLMLGTGLAGVAARFRRRRLAP